MKFFLVFTRGKTAIKRREISKKKHGVLKEKNILLTFPRTNHNEIGSDQVDQRNPLSPTT